MDSLPSGRCDHCGNITNDCSIQYKIHINTSRVAGLREHGDTAHAPPLRPRRLPQQRHPQLPPRGRPPLPRTSVSHGRPEFPRGPGATVTLNAQIVKSSFAIARPDHDEPRTRSQPMHRQGCSRRAAVGLEVAESATCTIENCDARASNSDTTNRIPGSLLAN